MCDSLRPNHQIGNGKEILFLSRQEYELVDTMVMFLKMCISAISAFVFNSILITGSSSMRSLGVAPKKRTGPSGSS